MNIKKEDIAGVCLAVVKTVSKYFENPDMLNNNRKGENIKCRQITHSILKNNTNIILAEIGNNVGNKDHATVLHSTRTTNNYRETNKSYNYDYKIVEDLAINAIRDYISSEYPQDVPLIERDDELSQAVQYLRGTINGNIQAAQCLNIIEKFIKYKQNGQN